MTTDWFSKRVLKWYETSGRKDLPWQLPPAPYRVWISEMMLQQTQVKTVIPYFLKFIKKFPTVIALANAPLDDVLTLWAGLGYYARARNLHQAARVIHEQYEGTFPSTLEKLIALPGIGPSTAGAIRALGFNKRAVILDGNVKRVLARFHAIDTWPGEKKTESQLWAYANLHTPKTQLRDYTQAMMDLGATLCTKRKPNCPACPLKLKCQAFKLQTPEAFPKPRPVRTVPTKKIQFLCLITGAREILLEQRPEKGIWGGLWSLPECATDESPIHTCKTQWNLNGTLLASLKLRRHTFTHFHLEYQVSVVKVRKPTHKLAKSNLAWYKLESEPNVGLPQPIRRLWTELYESELNGQYSVLS